MKVLSFQNNITQYKNKNSKVQANSLESPDPGNSLFKPVQPESYKAYFNNNITFKGNLANKAELEFIKIGKDIIKDFPNLTSSTRLIHEYKTALLNSGYTPCNSSITDDLRQKFGEDSFKIYENIITANSEVNTARIATDSFLKDRIPSSFNDYAKTIKKVCLEQKAGNCYEQSVIAASKLIDKGICSFDLITAKVPGRNDNWYNMNSHVFLVLHNEPKPNPSNIKEWKNAVIIDVWNRTAGTVKEQIENISKSILGLSDDSSITYKFSPHNITEAEKNRLKMLSSISPLTRILSSSKYS